MTFPEAPSAPKVEGKGRRTYSTLYKTVWMCVGLLLLGVVAHSWCYSLFLRLFLFLPALSVWSSASPYRFVLIPAWVRWVLIVLVVAAFYLLGGMRYGPQAIWALMLCPIVLSCFFRDPGREVPAEEDVFSYECWVKVGCYFQDLRFSIVVLFGLVFGTGLVVPVVLEQFQWVLGEDLSAGGLSAVGVYLLLTGVLGTWTSLGAFGLWAGRCGGRPLRFLIQVLGIVLTAFMTVPLAFLVTLALMWWKGRKVEK